MALMNGQTAEEIAHEVIVQATENVLIELDGTFSQKLDVLARYEQRDAIQIRGEKYWIDNQEKFRKDALQALVEAKHKAITSYMEKKAMQAKDEYFRMLRSKGVSPTEADRLAYHTGN